MQKYDLSPIIRRKDKHFFANDVHCELKIYKDSEKSWKATILAIVFVRKCIRLLKNCKYICIFTRLFVSFTNGENTFARKIVNTFAFLLAYSYLCSL